MLLSLSNATKICISGWSWAPSPDSWCSPSTHLCNLVTCRIKNLFPDFFWMTLILTPHFPSWKGRGLSSHSELQLGNPQAGKCWEWEIIQDERFCCIWPVSYILLYLLLAISKAGREGPNGPFNLRLDIFRYLWSAQLMYKILNIPRYCERWSALA